MTAHDGCTKLTCQIVIHNRLAIIDRRVAQAEQQIGWKLGLEDGADRATDPGAIRVSRAGDIIMTGYFVRQFPLAAGDRVRVDYPGVGTVGVAVDQALLRSAT